MRGSILVDVGRTEGANVRKMGSITPDTDCHHHYHCQRGQSNRDDDHYHEHCGDYCCCCFVVATRSRSVGAVSPAIMTCPLRRGITNNNDDVSHDGEEEYVNRYCVCDTNCPSICFNNTSITNNHCHGPCLICCGNSCSSPTISRVNCCSSNDELVNSSENGNDSSLSSRCRRRRDAESSFNDTNNNSNVINTNVNCSRLRRDTEGSSNTSSNNSFNCANASSDIDNKSSGSNSSSSSSDRRRRRRINSQSLLTRPCALYLFTVLVILDLSDLRSFLIASSFSRTASDTSSEVLNNVVSTMTRYNGFLASAAFENKNGHHYQGLEGLSMDSVFFDDSLGNRLTGSSESAEEEGENISEEEMEASSSNSEDDGDDQDDDGSSIEISRTVEPQMLKRLESQFLKLFGMSKRPQRAEQHKKQIKVPKYLLDLYQKQTGTELPTSNLNLPGRHTRTANTVRTFYHQPGNPKEPSYPWKGRENHIKFNLDSIPSMEKVTGAELRIPFVITVSSSELVNSATSFRESGSTDNNLRTHDDAGAELQYGQLKAVRILLHDVMKPATSPKSKKPKESHLLEPISYPIDSKTVVLSKRRNGTSSFWLTFDVFPAVARWMSNPRKNHGLVLEMIGVTNEGHTVPQETVVQRHNLRVKRDVESEESSSPSGKGHNSITTESSSSSSLSTSSSAARSKSTQDSGESQSSAKETPTYSSLVSSSSSSPSPTEVGVAANDGFISSNNERRRARTGDTSSSIVLFTYSDDGHNPVKTRDARTLSRHYRSAQAQKRRNKHRNKNRKRNLCQRHAMFVDFQDVGWNDWIVAPPGYAAYYCSGECPFPMAEHLNATNHAVIQALVHSMNPALVPPPCCVPTKYSSLSLLYTDSSDKIVLKNYNEMVVDSCGCS